MAETAAFQYISLNNGREIVTMPIGYYGYDAWYWGADEAIAETWRVVFPNTRSDTADRVEHYVRASSTLGGLADHDDATCEVCEYAHDDSDTLLNDLNDATPDGYVWLVDNGGLYLLGTNEDGEPIDIYGNAWE